MTNIINYLDVKARAMNDNAKPDAVAIDWLNPPGHVNPLTPPDASIGDILDYVRLTLEQSISRMQSNDYSGIERWRVILSDVLSTFGLTAEQFMLPSKSDLVLAARAMVVLRVKAETEKTDAHLSAIIGRNDVKAVHELCRVAVELVAKARGDVADGEHSTGE